MPVITSFLTALLMLGAAADDLKAADLTKPGVVPDALIVGRATCGAGSWLLTETPALIEIKVGAWTIAAHPIRGLKSEEKVWGLACLSDGSLWTLASPRTVARLEPTGQIVERIEIHLPRIALFAAGDRLLFEQLPMAPGAASLATSPPRQPQSVHAWPGLVGRSARSREEQLTRNLVNCGISFSGSVPCWFADERQFVVSDGSAIRRIDFAPLGSANVDPVAPIWDVAMVDADRFWLLASAPRGLPTRSGGRLYWSPGRARYTMIDLAPLARLVITATASQCVLLTTQGGFMEVRVTR
ncbi:MAG: hypothetical protein HY047_18330 [Acidobacteria bacterium]|nr:hypothetical protein [Acidobacteriota bacterium]